MYLPDDAGVVRQTAHNLEIDLAVGRQITKLAKHLLQFWRIRRCLPFRDGQNLFDLLSWQSSYSQFFPCLLHRLTL